MQWPSMFDGNETAKSSLFGRHVKATQAMWVPNRDQECGKGNSKKSPPPKSQKAQEGRARQLLKQRYKQGGVYMLRFFLLEI